MRRCRRCAVPLSMGIGMAAAAILPPKAVCVIAALLLIFTCLKCRR